MGRHKQRETPQREVYSPVPLSLISDKRFKGIYEKGRLRRVPDLLPVSMQDILHSGKPEL